MVIPTGTGKSLCLAKIASDAVTLWGGRVLILAYVRELLEQNADKVRRLCPEGNNLGRIWGEDGRIWVARLRFGRWRALSYAGAFFNTKGEAQCVSPFVLKNGGAIAAKSEWLLHSGSKIECCLDAAGTQLSAELRKLSSPHRLLQDAGWRSSFIDFLKVDKRAIIVVLFECFQEKQLGGILFVWVRLFFQCYIP